MVDVILGIAWIFFLIETIRICQGKGGKNDLIFLYIATIILFFTSVFLEPSYEKLGIWFNFFIFTIISQVCYLRKKKRKK